MKRLLGREVVFGVFLTCHWANLHIFVNSILYTFFLKKKIFLNSNLQQPEFFSPVSAHLDPFPSDQQTWEVTELTTQERMSALILS